MVTGQLPAQWKESLAIPLFKKEIAAHLYEYIDSNRFLNDNQFGFRWGRTADDQLLLTYGMVSLWYEWVSLLM